MKLGLWVKYRNVNTPLFNSSAITGSFFLRKKLPVDKAFAELAIFGWNEYESFRNGEPIVMETLVSKSL